MNSATPGELLPFGARGAGPRPRPPETLPPPRLGALARAGWVSAGWGRGLMGFGVVAAVGFLIPGPFRPPLVAQLPVYAMGILILRKLIGEARTGTTVSSSDGTRACLTPRG